MVGGVCKRVVARAGRGVLTFVCGVDFSIHFEGRNVAETQRIMAKLSEARRVLQRSVGCADKSHTDGGKGSHMPTHEWGWSKVVNCGLPLLCVEVEKPRVGIVEQLTPLADVVFVSQSFAHARGFASPEVCSGWLPRFHSPAPAPFPCCVAL